MVRSISGRISKEFWLIRKQHKENLRQALKGLDISDVAIDRIYAKKLRSINILEEFNLK